jgi:hypothetical protein
LGLEFLDRTLRTTGIVLLIFLPFGLYYIGVWPALAVFSGGVWGLVNLIFVSALIRAAIQTGEVDKMKTLGLVIIKFPLLYGAGYFLTQVPQFDPLYLLAGFTSLFVIIVLRGVGTAMMRASDRNGDSEKVRGIA